MRTFAEMIFTAVLAFCAVPLHAAELKVLAGGSMTSILGELAPQFERASGHKLDIQYAATPDLIKRAVSGAPFDAGVVPADVMGDAAARARFAPVTTGIARVGYSVAVRAGAPKPDISTPDAFKATLLKASSIAFIPESAAGAQVIKVFDRLGIAEAMKAKTKAQTTTGKIPLAVANGEAELGVFLTNVLVAPGVDLAGPFPAELQQELVFTGAIAAEPPNRDAAQALIDFLRSPDAIAVIKAKGMRPG